VDGAETFALVDDADAKRGRLNSEFLRKNIAQANRLNTVDPTLNPRARGCCTSFSPSRLPRSAREQLLRQSPSQQRKGDKLNQRKMIGGKYSQIYKHESIGRVRHMFWPDVPQ
jgi:hypothetical protein